MEGTPKTDDRWPSILLHDMPSKMCACQHPLIDMNQSPNFACVAGKFDIHQDAHTVLGILGIGYNECTS